MRERVYVLPGFNVAMNLSRIFLQRNPGGRWRGVQHAGGSWLVVSASFSPPVEIEELLGAGLLIARPIKGRRLKIIDVFIMKYLGQAFRYTVWGSDAAFECYMLTLFGRYSRDKRCLRF